MPILDLNLTSRDSLRELVKVRRAARITLPAEIRKQLEIAEGDYAEVIEGNLVLRARIGGRRPRRD